MAEKTNKSEAVRVMREFAWNLAGTLATRRPPTASERVTRRPVKR